MLYYWWRDYVRLSLPDLFVYFFVLFSKAYIHLVLFKKKKISDTEAVEVWYVYRWFFLFFFPQLKCLFTARISSNQIWNKGEIPLPLRTRVCPLHRMRILMMLGTALTRNQEIERSCWRKTTKPQAHHQKSIAIFSSSNIPHAISEPRTTCRVFGHNIWKGLQHIGH